MFHPGVFPNPKTVVTRHPLIVCLDFSHSPPFQLFFVVLHVWGRAPMWPGGPLDTLVSFKTVVLSFPTFSRGLGSNNFGVLFPFGAPFIPLDFARSSSPSPALFWAVYFRSANKTAIEPGLGTSPSYGAFPQPPPWCFCSPLF